MNSVPRREGNRTPVNASRATEYHQVGNDSRNTYVSPEQQTKNMQPKSKEEYRTDPDKQTGTIMNKGDIQARDGWVSPYPVGHPNYTTMVK